MKLFRSIELPSLVALSLISANVHAYNFPANFINLSQWLCTLDCPHWYVGGNIGVSHLFDKKTPNTPDSVDQNGPGWNANIGYQFNEFLGAELGYTQYHDSRETLGNFAGLTPLTIAKTEHYSTYVAATGRVPVWCGFGILGKLGVAYSYANKIFTLGPSASSGSVSAFYGLGVFYSVTKNVDFIGQWARARGNNFTGSADLYSLGATFAIV